MESFLKSFLVFLVGVREITIINKKQDAGVYHAFLL
jgi:hypothetical protein